MYIYIYIWVKSDIYMGLESDIETDIEKTLFDSVLTGIQCGVELKVLWILWNAAAGSMMNQTEKRVVTKPWQHYQRCEFLQLWPRRLRDLIYLNSRHAAWYVSMKCWCNMTVKVRLLDFFNDWKNLNEVTPV